MELHGDIIYPGAQSGILTVSFSGNWNKNHVLIVADSITVTDQRVGFRAELQDCLMVINFFSLVHQLHFTYIAFSRIGNYN